MICMKCQKTPLYPHMPMTLKYFTRVITKWNSNRLLALILKGLMNGLIRTKCKEIPANTQPLYLAICMRTGPPRFVCENTIIPLNEKVELLGVTINKKLNFDAHVAKICRRVSQQVAVLRRMKKMLPFETRMKLYQSFIVPYFNYCAETWNFHSKGATTKLEKLNERALRFVYRDHNSSYEMLLKQSGYQTLLNQRLAKILTTVYKVVNRQCVSESLRDLAEPRKSNYNLRGDKILTLPKVNTTKYGLKSVRYEEANLWNKLPNEYRKADSYKLFKKQILDTDLAGRYMS